jgi:hydroxymethylglutaryl-CoA lyase
MNSAILLTEVGLRDGLQNEKTIVATKDKLNWAKKLIEAGVKKIELGAFVRSDRVPQMADTEYVVKKFLQRKSKNSKAKDIFTTVLVPNMIGFEQAKNFKVDQISVFTACTNSFTKANINCSVEESFQRFKPVILAAKKQKIKTRGYLSTAFGCPYEGRVSLETVIKYTKKLIEIGCDEISIGDTIGVAAPKEVERTLIALKKVIPTKKLIMHFHDTRGTALANIFASLQQGITQFDTSIGGLGGCPYAPGASGNVATEDVVYMLHRMGFKTNIDLEKLTKLTKQISKVLNKNLPSKLSKI